VTVKQKLPPQCAVPFKALPPSSIMTRPTEALSSRTLSIDASLPPIVPYNALPLAMHVYALIRGSAEVSSLCVPLEALPSVRLIEGLDLAPTRGMGNLRQCVGWSRLSASALEWSMAKPSVSPISVSSGDPGPSRSVVPLGPGGGDAVCCHHRIAIR
jgi:hypothetical protein